MIWFEPEHCIDEPVLPFQSRRPACDRAATTIFSNATLQPSLVGEKGFLEKDCLILIWMLFGKGANQLCQPDGLSCPKALCFLAFSSPDGHTLFPLP